MSVIESVLISANLGKIIIVPILRILASIFFAISISQDSKARKIGSYKLWGLCTFIFPVLFALIYFIYSRFLCDKDIKIHSSKKSKIFFILALFTYLIMITAFIIFTIITVSSGFAYSIT